MQIPEALPGMCCWLGPRSPCGLKVAARCEASVIKVIGIQGGGLGDTEGHLAGCGNRHKSKSQGAPTPGNFSSGWVSGQVGTRSVRWVVTDTNTFIREIPQRASWRVPGAEGIFNYYFN